MDTSARPVMQRDNEQSRIVVEGRRTDDGSRCTLVAVQETTGMWAIYPHGVGKLGVRLHPGNAVRIAQAILAGADHPPGC